MAVKSFCGKQQKQEHLSAFILWFVWCVQIVMKDFLISDVKDMGGKCLVYVLLVWCMFVIKSTESSQAILFKEISSVSQACKMGLQFPSIIHV